MSSPSRSDTYHLMVESLLQQRGWDEGWHCCSMFPESGDYLITQFRWRTKSKAGLGGAAPVIDTTPGCCWAIRSWPLIICRIPRHPLTFVAISRHSLNKDKARALSVFAPVNRAERAGGQQHR